MGSAPSQTDPIYQEAVSKISEAFDYYDKNKNGILSKREFFKLVYENLPEQGASNITTADMEAWFVSLDRNGDGVVDRTEFVQWWASPSTATLNQTVNQTKLLDGVRTRMATKRGIFLGFTYDNLQRSKTLDPANVRHWPPKDVMVYLVSRPELSVLRAELVRDLWIDIDGETLLELQEEDLVSKGIKKYHVKKIMRTIESLRSSSNEAAQATLVQSPKPSTALRKKTSSSLQQEPHPHSDVPLPRKIRRTGSNASEAGFDWKKSDLLGRGAFGEVYLGLDNQTGALLAVKEISFTRENVADMQELKLEITLLRALDHKHIVRYLGAEVPNDDSSQGLMLLHIFTEYMPGGSILGLIKRFGALSESVVRNYTRQMVDGLIYLHSKGIIHRDIKPANILVDERGTVKLADFGASKQINTGAGGQTLELENQTLKGTPYFMAPEVMTQSGHGRKADIWSLAGTVMQMRTAVPPWKAEKFAGIIQLMCHIGGDPTAIPTLPSKEEVGVQLHDFLCQCFQRDPVQRPTATALSAHVFLASNANCFEAEDDDPMMNTLAMIESKWEKAGGGGGGGGGGGTSSPHNNTEKSWSVVSDLDLSFAVTQDHTNDKAQGNHSSNPFASDSQHIDTEGHVLASQTFSARDPTDRKDVAEQVLVADNNKGGGEIRSGTLTTAAPGGWKQHYQKMTDDVVTETVRKEIEKQMKKNNKNKNGGGEMANSWKQREERPIQSKMHDRDVEQLNKLNRAKAEADREYKKELEMARTMMNAAEYDLSEMDEM